MRLEFDPDKRARTLAQRGLDFLDATEVFQGPLLQAEDERIDYGETRFISFGPLRGRLVVLVWTPRGETRRIISMRYANEREIARYEFQMGRPG